MGSRPQLGQRVAERPSCTSNRAAVTPVLQCAELAPSSWQNQAQAGFASHGPTIVRRRPTPYSAPARAALATGHQPKHGLSSMEALMQNGGVGRQPRYHGCTGAGAPRPSHVQTADVNLSGCHAATHATTYGKKATDKLRQATVRLFFPCRQVFGSNGEAAIGLHSVRPPTQVLISQSADCVQGNDCATSAAHESLRRSSPRQLVSPASHPGHRQCSSLRSSHALTISPFETTHWTALELGFPHSTRAKVLRAAR